MLNLRRVGLALLLLVIAFVSAPVPAANAQYPPTTPPSLTVSPHSGLPGYPVTITVSNCLPGEQIIFTLAGQQYTATCDPITLQATVTIPAPTTTGPYELCAIFMGPAALTQGFRSATLAAPAQATPRLTLCDSIEVTTATVPSTTAPPVTPTTPPSGNIPTTGSSGIASTSTIAIVLLVAGSCMVIVARLRRRSAPPAA